MKTIWQGVEILSKNVKGKSKIQIHMIMAKLLQPISVFHNLFIFIITFSLRILF